MSMVSVRGFWVVVRVCVFLHVLIACWQYV
jgi:hypothetical protein